MSLVRIWFLINKKKNETEFWKKYFQALHFTSLDGMVATINIGRYATCVRIVAKLATVAIYVWYGRFFCVQDIPLTATNGYKTA